jgi:hypothetical protein
MGQVPLHQAGRAGRRVISTTLNQGRRASSVAASLRLRFCIIRRVAAKAAAFNPTFPNLSGSRDQKEVRRTFIAWPDKSESYDSDRNIPRPLGRQTFYRYSR